MALVEAFLEILKRPTIWAMIIGMIQFLGPIWIAFLVGIMVGWVWKPRWASLGNCKFEFSAPSSPAALAPSPVQGFGSTQSLDSCKAKVVSFGSCASDNAMGKEQIASVAVDDAVCSSSELGKEEGVLITYEDLEHLCHLVERKDAGPPWKHVMDRSTQSMSYQAWQREPETGPPQYCSRTVYEDATPELVRDFFWDDEFRLKWDDMLIHASILEECPTTGTMMVHWIRKSVHSDREYIIGRRIWSQEDHIIVGFPVFLFQGGTNRDGLIFTTRVGSFKQGMWGTVKNIERGFRAYQKHRLSGAPISRHAFMAQFNTKLDPDYLKILEGEGEPSETQSQDLADEKPKRVNIPKLLIIGGAIAVACSLDRGLLTKTLIFGVARRFGNVGRRACPGAN
ncbi:UNVERIFIED_CONTAM: hypothetical protein Scaly_0535700 [Sesamum calycinum]|uniref:START domain-containing protein n=1 Tax=Sesamum calycinum TaxID=2727403 RepID=A0AAW2RQW2_9LAMI